MGIGPICPKCKKEILVLQTVVVNKDDLVEHEDCKNPRYITGVSNQMPLGPAPDDAE